MKDLMDVKLFLKNNMSWCAAYNCSNSSKNNPDKTLVKITQTKPLIRCYKPKKGTFSESVYLCSNHFEEACFDKSWENYFTHHVPRKENL